MLGCEKSYHLFLDLKVSQTIYNTYVVKFVRTMYLPIREISFYESKDGDEEKFYHRFTQPLTIRYFP